MHERPRKTGPIFKMETRPTRRRGGFTLVGGLALVERGKLQATEVAVPKVGGWMKLTANDRVGR
jgi:hypothetical protein